MRKSLLVTKQNTLRHSPRGREVRRREQKGSQEGQDLQLSVAEEEQDMREVNVPAACQFAPQRARNSHEEAGHAADADHAPGPRVALLLL